MNAQMWSHQTFCELMAHSPKQAFEYRHRVLGDPIPPQYLDKTEETVVETVAEEEKPVENVENVEKPVETETSDAPADVVSENVETPVKTASKRVKKA